MPYINRAVRESLVEGRKSCLPGELNFVLAREIDEYLMRKTVSYSSLNEVVGVLECLKMEIYRRIAAPFEDKKSSENGDVFHAVSQS